MRVWKQPFFDDGICQLAVYKFSNASDYQVQQTQNLLLLAQLRNSTFVEIDAETGWEVWRTATHIVNNWGTQENLQDPGAMEQSVRVHHLQGGGLRV